MAIEIYNSETGCVEAEDVCQEGFLRFLYSNPAGRLLLWALVKRRAFSGAFGMWASSPISRPAVMRFIDAHGIRVGEMLKRPSAFRSFNDFFTRELKPGARPVSGGANDISFPADGRHLAVADVSASDTFYAKGQKFRLESFLGSPELAARFEGGAMLISRLSPLDYHRFHFPVSGIVEARRLIGGFLYTVSPIALRRNIGYLAENKRMLNLISLENGGMCAMVEIGATNVGSIVQLSGVGGAVRRGDCKGYFQFGGSCVATIFERGLAKFSDALLECSEKPIEYYARANSKAGELTF